MNEKCTAANEACPLHNSKKAEKLKTEGKYAEAITLLDKIIKQNPKDIYALMNSRNCLY